MGKCLICGREFSKKSHNQKYCSIQCRAESERKMIECGYCKKKVKVRKKTAKYCSMMCASLGEGRRVLYKCKQCNKEFTQKASKSNYDYSQYCSKECHNLSMRQPYWFCCIECGVLVEVYSINKIKKRKFCTTECKEKHFARGIDESLVVKMYVEEEMTAAVIAEKLNTNDKHILKILENNNIERRFNGYGNRLTCSDGHVVKSYYEKVFDDRLSHYGIPHEYEPRISEKGRYFADFKVSDVYIEIWGLYGRESYDKRRKLKLNFYKKHNKKLLEVFPEDFRDIDKKINELKHLIS